MSSHVPWTRQSSPRHIILIEIWSKITWVVVAIRFDSLVRRLDTPSPVPSESEKLTDTF